MNILLYIENNENVLETCQNITDLIYVKINNTGIFKLENDREAITIEDKIQLKPNTKSSKAFS